MRLLRWSLLFSIGILVWNVECLRVVGAAFSFDECPNGTKTTTSENNDDYYSPELDTPYNPFTDTRKPWREACPSIDVNHRGRYTSRLWPCVFSFHSTAVDERDPYTSSTACNNENQVLDHVVHEYIENWPDECVGDYARCYSVEQDKSVLMKFLCRTRWKLPEITTHISVNCTKDRSVEKLVHNHMANRERTETVAIGREMVTEEEIVGFSVLTFLTLMCFMCFICAYRWIVRPYTDAMVAVTSSEGEQLLKDEPPQDDDEEPIEAQVT